MSEIPEHLLKRSRSAKSGKTGGDAGASESAPVAASPSAPAASAPAAASVPANLPNLDPEPVPAKPDAPYVAAAKARRRVPVWALPIVVALPVWAIAYPGTMQEPPKEDPLLMESTLFYNQAGCSGCHGAGGGGGTGYRLHQRVGAPDVPQPDRPDGARGPGLGRHPGPGLRGRAQGRRAAGGGGQGQRPDASPGEAAQPAQAGDGRLPRAGQSCRARNRRAPEYIEWMDSMRERFEAGDADADRPGVPAPVRQPGVTPGATGEGSTDEAKPCPGPPPAEDAPEPETALRVRPTRGPEPC